MGRRLQPLTAAGPTRRGILDFLICRGDMNRPGLRQWHDCRQFVWRHGPAGCAERHRYCTGQRADGGSCVAAISLGKLVDRADEPALAGMCAAPPNELCA